MLTPGAQILVRFALQLAVSEIQHVHGRRKSKMHRKWPKTELKHITAKSTVYMLLSKYLPLRPKFSPFRSMISPFRDTTCTRSGKSEMHRMTPNWTWTLGSQKNSVYTKHVILVRFALWLALSAIQCRQKSEIHRSIDPKLNLYI